MNTLVFVEFAGIVGLVWDKYIRGEIHKNPVMILFAQGLLGAGLLVLANLSPGIAVGFGAIILLGLALGTAKKTAPAPPQKGIPA